MRSCSRSRPHSCSRSRRAVATTTMTTPLARATNPPRPPRPPKKRRIRPPPSAPADDGGASDQAATVALGESALGDVLVDESGLTLYVFNNDTPGASVCTEGCAEAWPPRDRSRRDRRRRRPRRSVCSPRSTAATARCSSRSTASRCTASPATPRAGDVNGQGVGEVWFVAAPDGSGIEAAAAEGASQGDAGLLIRRCSRRPRRAAGAAR